MYCLCNKLLRYKPDKDYPLLLCDDVGVLVPMFVNRDSLNIGIGIVHQLIRTNSITVAQAKSFLKYKGFNNDVQEKLSNAQRTQRNLVMRTLIKILTHPD
jgi:hypothetical protein